MDSRSGPRQLSATCISLHAFVEARRAGSEVDVVEAGEAEHDETVAGLSPVVRGGRRASRRSSGGPKAPRPAVASGRRRTDEPTGIQMPIPSEKLRRRVQAGSLAGGVGPAKGRTSASCAPSSPKKLARSGLTMSPKHDARGRRVRQRGSRRLTRGPGALAGAETACSSVRPTYHWRAKRSPPSKAYAEPRRSRPA